VLKYRDSLKREKTEKFQKTPRKIESGSGHVDMRTQATDRVIFELYKE